MAIVFVIFSYVGTEVVAVTAGEAKNPEIAIPQRNCPYPWPRV